MSNWQISAMTSIDNGVHFYVYGDDDYGWQFEASLASQGKLDPGRRVYGSSSSYKTAADAMYEAEEWLSTYLALRAAEPPTLETCPDCNYSGSINVPSPGLRFDPMTGSQRKICMCCWQHFD